MTAADSSRSTSRPSDASSDKLCTRCNQVKPRSEFHRHCRKPDGLRSHCKACRKIDAKAEYHADPGRAIARSAAWARANPERASALKAAWTARNPEKTLAHRRLNDAVKTGRIERPEKCELCDTQGRVEGHHADYGRPLDVQWLCTRCHADLHLSERAA
jgi:hypothetical protein